MATYKYLGGRPLLHFYEIEIQEENGSLVVYFNSTIHVQRRARMPTSYSTKFTHGQILHDASLIRQINERYGKVIKPDEAPF